MVEFKKCKNYKIFDYFKNKRCAYMDINIDIMRERLKSIQMFIMSPHEIKVRSGGEVLNSKLTNYKTMLPEKGGLFCETIFGPLKYYECRCTQLKGYKYKGKHCSSCHVEVNNPRIRRYRIGHIQLASPIPHVWFLRVSPFYFQTLLGLNIKELETIFLSREPVMLTIIPESITSYYLPSKKKKQFQGSGCKVIYDYLCSINLYNEYWNLRKKIFDSMIHEKISNKKKSYFDIAFEEKKKEYLLLLKRLKMITYLIKTKRRPEWMMFTTLAVLPPEIRPFLILKDNLIVSSDLNMFYKRIIERNNRLKALHSINKKNKEYLTDPFSLNELTLLQHAIDSLIDNGRRGRIALNKRKIPLKSLVEILKGKEGRFRMNLLGKRVDYSGRTVISVGPRLKLTQCGLPIEIALILYQVYICKKLHSLTNRIHKILYSIYQKNITNYKNIKNKSTSFNWIHYLNQSYIFGLIDDLIYEHPIVLNRAPTLHRMNVQPFQPILINNKAIQLHPLVCSSFNADFDGDQMAIHYALSLISQVEVRIIMMSYNNIISPANGNVIIGPSQDIVFGLYYTTMMVNTSQCFYFHTLVDVKKALFDKIVSLQTKIQFYQNSEYVITTPGRILISHLIPELIRPYIKWNELLTKKSIQDIIFQVYLHADKEELLFLLDQLMAYGFSGAHMAGISLSIQDIVIPSLKERIINKELINKKGNMQSKWSTIQTQITALILRDVNLSKKSEIPPIYMLIHSGARGSIIQMRQLAGIRGLMVKPSGEIIELAIPSNFREGLGLLYYYYSTHGARKGVIDTSIRTATSGYLTRRLIYTAQDYVITEEDCFTKHFIRLRAEYKDGKEIRSLGQLAMGRTVFKDVFHPVTGEIIFYQNSIIYPEQIEKFKEVEEILVRSPLTCHSTDGICQYCYGLNLASGNLPSIGEAVGVIAAQSIGEPGTQLTMRTFHMGGVLLGSQSSSSIRSGYSGRIYYKYGVVLPMETMQRKNTNSSYYISTKSSLELYILNENDYILTIYEIPIGSLLYYKENEFIYKGDLLFEFNSNFEPIFYKQIESGYFKYQKTKYSQLPSILKIYNKKKELSYNLVEIKRKQLLAIPNVYYVLPEDVLPSLKTTLSNHLSFGNVLYFIPRSGRNREDITGGLSKISQLFEWTNKEKDATLAPFSGYVALRPLQEEKLPNYWEILFLNQNSSINYFKSYYVNYQKMKLKIRSATFVEKGESFVRDILPWKEILSLFGAAITIEKLRNEIVSIFLENGVYIHDKHLELIFKRMFGYITIYENNYIPYVMHEEVKYSDFLKENIKNLIKGVSLAKGYPLARGITKVSLDTTSFLAAASFQNTAQALNRSAMEGHKDNFEGLSIQVMIGRISPIGSGLINFNE